MRIIENILSGIWAIIKVIGILALTLIQIALLFVDSTPD